MSQCGAPPVLLDGMSEGGWGDPRDCDVDGYQSDVQIYDVEEYPRVGSSINEDKFFGAYRTLVHSLAETSSDYMNPDEPLLALLDTVCFDGERFNFHESGGWHVLKTFSDNAEKYIRTIQREVGNIVVVYNAMLPVVAAVVIGTHSPSKMTKSIYVSRQKLCAFSVVGHEYDRDIFSPEVAFKWLGGNEKAIPPQFVSDPRLAIEYALVALLNRVRNKTRAYPVRLGGILAGKWLRKPIKDEAGIYRLTFNSYKSYARYASSLPPAISAKLINATNTNVIKPAHDQPTIKTIVTFFQPCARCPEDATTSESAIYDAMKVTLLTGDGITLSVDYVKHRAEVTTCVLPGEKGVLQLYPNGQGEEHVIARIQNLPTVHDALGELLSNYASRHPLRATLDVFVPPSMAMNLSGDGHFMDALLPA